MAKKKAPKDLIVEHEGTLYVRTDAIMEPFIVFHDGLSVCFFDKRKQSYLSFDTAIKWCRKEGEYANREHYDSTIRELERISRECKINPEPNPPPCDPCDNRGEECEPGEKAEVKKEESV